MGPVQVVAFVSALLAIAFSACPQEWVRHNGKCYKFQLEIENWVNARQMCQMHKSDLIVIETAAEQAWFRKKARSFNFTNQDDGFWLGATDWIKEGAFIWEPTQQPATNIVWGQGQPNNRNGSENCLAAMDYFDYVWSDEFCNWVRLNYVCEMAEPSGPIVG